METILYIRIFSLFHFQVTEIDISDFRSDVISILAYSHVSSFCASPSHHSHTRKLYAETYRAKLCQSKRETKANFLRVSLSPCLKYRQRRALKRTCDSILIYHDRTPARIPVVLYIHIYAAAAGGLIFRIYCGKVFNPSRYRKIQSNGGPFSSSSSSDYDSPRTIKTTAEYRSMRRTGSSDTE